MSISVFRPDPTANLCSLSGVVGEDLSSLSLPGVGIELFSHTVARGVSSPLQSLTSVFGMGTGGPSAFVTPTQRSLPEN